MNQAELNRALARATNESVATIRRLGFLLVEPPNIQDATDANEGPHVVDWDEVQAERCSEITVWPIGRPAVA